jgi:hypothetical protein
MAFDLTLPEVQQVAVPEVIITIDNVSQDIETNLALAVASPYSIDVTYRPYLNVDLTGPQMNPPMTLSLTQVEATDYKVTARATFGDLANRQFPSIVYTMANFPGLVR